MAGNPVRSDVHIDVALSNVSIKYRNFQYVAESLCPSLFVNKDSNKFFVYGKENFNTFDDVRAPGTRGQEVDWTLSTSSYLLSEHSLEKSIPDEVRDDADAPLQIEPDTTEILTDMLLLRLEKDVADFATTTSNYAAGSTKDLSAAGYLRWDDDNSDPIGDIMSAHSVIHAATGQKANILVLGRQVYLKLRNHPKIIERIKFSQLGVADMGLMAQLFDVDQVVIGSALKNTVIEGETAALSYVWGKNAVLAYRPSSMALKVLAFASVFRRIGWRKTEMWREDPRRCDLIRVSDKYQVLGISNVAGFLFQNAVV